MRFYGCSTAGHAGACVLALLRAEGSCVCERGIQETETQAGSHVGAWRTHVGACSRVCSSTQTTLLRGFLMQLRADDTQQRRIHAGACPRLQKSGSWFCYLTQLHKFVHYCVATWCKVQEL